MNHAWAVRLANSVLIAVFLIVAGCRPAPSQRQEAVVIYTSVDEPVASPILQAFTQQTGIPVLIRTDTEATKSVGLAERLEAEKANPQADVWWGNEVFYTIRLARHEVLAPYASPAAAEIPANYKDAKNRWAGTALRARVIGRSFATPEATGATASIRSIRDLTSPQLKGRIGMARPAAGTTSGHMAALYTLWGRPAFEQFLQELKANDVKLVGGNAAVAEMVGQGTLWAGLTDNDDVEAMRREKGKLELVLPDQGEGQIGTLTIPCTVGLVAGAKRDAAAKKLVDYLLSREVEGKLLAANFARYSVFASAGENSVRAITVDYTAIAANMKEAIQTSLRILEGRQ